MTMVAGKGSLLGVMSISLSSIGMEIGRFLSHGVGLKMGVRL